MINAQHTISIDPGVNEVGVAYWEGTELFSAGLVRGNVVEGMTTWSQRRASYVHTIVIEKPQVYRQHLLKGDPNDLIALAIVVGSIENDMKHAWPGAKVVEVLPREWKGQTPKAISTARSKKALSAEERERVQLPTAKSLAHNVWDGVGIGLYWVGRK